MTEAAALAPPAKPWTALPIGEDAGYISIYYSDDLSRLPIRFVTKPGDNKSDPNLETLTYGLFSTCGPGMRSSIVQRGHPNIFFATHWKGTRALAGMYHIGWYAPAASSRKNDYYLAADIAHFIDEPIPLAKIDRLCRTRCSRRFRNSLMLTTVECARIRDVLLQRENEIEEYISEIHRLERLSLAHTGYRYPSWKRVDGFDWNKATSHLKAGPAAIASVTNSTLSGKWTCSACGQSLINKALLRQCPSCGQLGTLTAS